MNTDQAKNLALSRVKGSNRAIVSMGYNSIESNIILSTGNGNKLPDPLANGSYDLVWWNISDYVNPSNDPYAEIVKCIAKVGDTIIIMRSQYGPAYDKNIIGKTYGISPIYISNTENTDNIPSKDSISSLSYYNIPQVHGSQYHEATVETTAGSQSKVNTHATLISGIHGVTGNIVGTTDSQTLSTKTLDNTNTITVKDSNLTIQNSTTTTKQAKFQALSITDNTIRTITLQDADIIMESTDGSQSKVDVHKGITASVHNFDQDGNSPAQSHNNTKHSEPYITQSAITAHNVTTGVHGVGISNVESESGSTSKVNTHASLPTGVHGVTGSILGTEKMGVQNGIASLDSNGKIPTTQLPGLSLTNVYTVASQEEQLALTTQEGDVVIRTDENKSYVRNSGTTGTMADYSLLLTPPNSILSVFGRTGAITSATNDYTWAQIDKTTSNIADIATKSHTSLTDVGTNTHAQIDTAIGTTLPNLVTTHASAITSVHGVGSSTVESVVGSQAKVDAHANNTTTAHGSTSAATINTIMQRDANGRAKIATPSFSDDIARKDTVDAVQTNLGTHTGLTTGVHGVGANTIEHTGNKNAANGYAGLNSSKHSITSFPIVSTGISYTAIASDYTIVCTAAITITIPAASTMPGKIYKIKSNATTGNVIISSESLIDAFLTYTMYARYETVCIQSDGAQWFVI